MPIVQYGTGQPQGGDYWSQFGPHVDEGAPLSRIGGMSGDQSNPNGAPLMSGNDGMVQPQVQHQLPDGTWVSPSQWQAMQGGGQSTGTIDQLKQLVGNDWSPQHLAQIAPQIKALGIEIQNQERGDLRPRFRIGGEQWDFGPGGWINSGHGVQPGFGDASQAPKGTMGQPGGSSGGILGALKDTPGYQFTVDEALRGVQSSAAAKGSLLTGGTLKALMDRAAGLAGTRYDTTVDQYGRAAQIGQNAIQQGSS